MIHPVETRVVVPSGLSLDDFAPDTPKRFGAGSNVSAQPIDDSFIDGVSTAALTPHDDPRGSLCELLTTREGPIEPIVHVYHVWAAPGSIRGWLYHRHQFDRLAFINGSFEIVLYDIRPGSPTLNHLQVFHLGEHQPALLRIPPFIVHGVRNTGNAWAHFVNMPTNVYRRETPDKCRLDVDDPRIPYAFR
jgi:dTDP-4-dehydrorhamnose 3,5-epimerase